MPAVRRLRSPDVFRGPPVAALVLVNSPGSDDVFAPLRHADWNGWTPTDLIFPAFLVIMGVASVFSGRRALMVYVLAGLAYGIQEFVRMPLPDGSAGNLKLWLNASLFGSWLPPRAASLAYALVFTAAAMALAAVARPSKTEAP